MKCPIDDSTLSISSREGIEIDFCPQCRGVWLDRGELDKILERASASLAPASGGSSRDPRYERDMHQSKDRYDERDDRRYDDNPRYRKRKKRGSFLEDLFDFD